MVKFVVLLFAVAFILSKIDLSQLTSRILMISPFVFLAVLVLVGANFLATSWRLTRIFRLAGQTLSYRTGLLANASGLVASLFVVNFVGATVGRQYHLQQHGYDPALTTLVVSYERALLALISALLALLGSMYVLGANAIAAYFADQPLLMMLATAFATLVTCAMLFNTNTDRHLRNRLFQKDNGRSIVEAGAITLVSSFFNLTTYVLLIFALGYELPLASVVAAAAVVAFAASLPITINGWGVREVAAIFVFGIFDVSQTDAIAVSVAVGLINFFLSCCSPPSCWHQGRRTALTTQYLKIQPRGAAPKT